LLSQLPRSGDRGCGGASRTILDAGDYSPTSGSFAHDDKNVGTGKTVTVSGVTVNDGNGGNGVAYSGFVAG
jgi:hypothetical protein